MDRITKLHNYLSENNLDAIFLTKEPNVNYISAFTDEEAMALVSTKGNYLITDGRFTELAESICTGFEVVNWQLFERNRNKAVLSLCERNGIKRLGFEQEDLSFEKYASLNETLADVELVPTSGVIEALRYVKTEEELANSRKACEIADKALEELLPYIKVGASERELCARLEFNMKMHGAQAIGFETILISGAKTSLPHGKPNDKCIEEGDFVTIDFGAMYNGYISDMTRTFVVGKASEKQKEVYELVRAAQQAGLDHMYAGAHATEPDRAVREIVKKYEEYYYPGMGHGVGREVHEEPFLGNYGTRTMEKGCIITMEPGLYIPGWGGVRIEDTVLITEDGCERLTHFPKELMEL